MNTQWKPKSYVIPSRHVRQKTEKPKGVCCEEKSTSDGIAPTLTAGGNNIRKSTSKTKSTGNIKFPTRVNKLKPGAIKSRKLNFSYVGHLKEDHGMPIFGCQFKTSTNDGDPLILATVGSNRVSVYECLPDGPLKSVQVYVDPDIDENYYTCAWTHDREGLPLLAAAGKRGVIRLFDPQMAKSVRNYLGHGHAINELLFHTTDANLLLSASKDHSVRLWNVQTHYCVVIFGGIEGHAGEVLAADINVTGSLMVSCGMDHSLKVWKLDKPEIEDGIRLSYEFDQNSKPFPTVLEHFPTFSTMDIHRDYIDCVKWFGDLIVSKSCENIIVIWKGGKTCDTWEEVTNSTTETATIASFEIQDCDIWFIRFSIDSCKNTLALGNSKGKTYIFNLNVTDPAKIRSKILTHRECKSPIRQTALSSDGTVLICVCDDSTIWRWSKI